jgi:DNA-binding CsgD family transcriptional regulator
MASIKLVAPVKLLNGPDTMTIATEDALHSLVDRIYESIERPELWPKTISAMVELVGGRHGFWGMDEDIEGLAVDVSWNRQIFGTSCSPTLFLSRGDLKALDQYAEEFGELIIRLLKIVFLSTLWPEKGAEAREAIGLRMARRYLPAFECIEGTSVSSPSMPALRKLIAALWEDGCVFSLDNLRCMRLLVPHLDRALRLQTRLRSADLNADMTSGALDALTIGVVFVARSGRPLWLNRRAQEVIGHSDALRFSSAGLVGRTASDTRSLRELIKGAVSEGTRGLLAVSRSDDLRPLLLIAVPLKSMRPLNGSDDSTCGVVFISDPSWMDDPSAESLRKAYGLTNREAQITIAIARGHGLQAAAETTGVAITTARSQLQQAFLKTGTSHQAELAALVHRTLTHLRHDNPRR